MKGGTYKTLDVPGAQETLGGGINNAGLMTEVWLDSSFSSESSLYNGKKYTKINIPGETDSYVSAISNLGDIVYSWESAETYGGALRHAGRVYKFHVPKGDRTFGYGINDHNVIVGAFTGDNGVLSGFSRLIRVNAPQRGLRPFGQSGEEPGHRSSLPAAGAVRPK